MLRCALVSCALLILTLPALAEDKPGYIGVQLKVQEVSGKIVIQIVIGEGPAQKAGLMAGDIILKIDDKQPENLQDVVDKVRAKKPGDKVEIKVNRDEKEMTFKITVGEMPKEDKPG